MDLGEGAVDEAVEENFSRDCPVVRLVSKDAGESVSGGMMASFKDTHRRDAFYLLWGTGVLWGYFVKFANFSS